MTTFQRLPADGGQKLEILRITFIADGSGNDTFDIPILVDGLLIAVDTIPDAFNPPTVNWDMTLTTVEGLDVFGGNGANRSDTVCQRFAPAVSPAPLCKTSLTLNVSNAGAAGQAIVDLHILCRV